MPIESYVKAVVLNLPTSHLLPDHFLKITLPAPDASSTHVANSEANTGASLASVIASVTVAVPTELSEASVPLKSM